MSNRFSRTVVVNNQLGLHNAPTCKLVDTANQFDSIVVFERHGDEPDKADGKSVMQVICLAACYGTTLTIHAEGDDAEAAVNALAELFENRFGEE
jgi:phosphocarrier protein HPr